ncbi:hypothetical protein OIU84_001383 [Salix udensis]|uniref:Uncharacterized protein n=1 Tax=Salix udensis TaxID=889485 RepID=A0AAD6P6N5_9ROSI|nr:hypothetical protein OIU84_001383 [Salix udensis]
MVWCWKGQLVLIERNPRTLEFALVQSI